MRFRLLILFFTCVPIAVGCIGSVPQTLSPEHFYKRDMTITVNEIEAEGVLVVPRSADEIYEMTIENKGKIDLFTFTTCHREDTREIAKGGIFGRFKREVEFSYVPVPGIETGRYCPIKLGGYEMVKGRHSWGFLDFESSDHLLPARLSCSGDASDGLGVSICQSKAGLIQRIEFPEKTRVAAGRNSCPALKSEDGKLYEFEPSLGICVYAFEGKTSSRRHRLTVLGYEKILVRAD